MKRVLLKAHENKRCARDNRKLPGAVVRRNVFGMEIEPARRVAIAEWAPGDELGRDTSKWPDDSDINRRLKLGYVTDALIARRSQLSKFDHPSPTAASSENSHPVVDFLVAAGYLEESEALCDVGEWLRAWRTLAREELTFMEHARWLFCAAPHLLSTVPAEKEWPTGAVFARMQARANEIAAEIHDVGCVRPYHLACATLLAAWARAVRFFAAICNLPVMFGISRAAMLAHAVAVDSEIEPWVVWELVIPTLAPGHDDVLTDDLLRELREDSPVELDWNEATSAVRDCLDGKVLERMRFFATRAVGPPVPRRIVDSGVQKFL